ncbi:hypothetical protein [Mariprofundus sp. KV]|uniref:hypothetical protein n=1 Tax=Mariprofundus sp. KV TaxID=2608715 RepID=UPI0015A25723|nr:hypothetical protein [Mariprofundus sp. KV]NWF36118.1 hypothetical protein [Mariprofundus sp. KV]
MVQQQDSTLSRGWRVISTIDSSHSLISWVGITLTTFIAAIVADMAHASKSTVVIIGVAVFILTTLLVMTILGRRKAVEEKRMIDSTAKISLLQLRSEALLRGWNFSRGSEQTLEFTLTVSQAALDCQIEFWGRKEIDAAEEVIRSNPLQPIPAGHWLEFAVEPVRFVTSTDNYFTRSYEFPSLEKKGYLDLHLNREQALIWLDTTAESSRNPDLKSQPTD